MYSLWLLGKEELHFFLKSMAPHRLVTLQWMAPYAEGTAQIGADELCFFIFIYFNLYV